MCASGYCAKYDKDVTLRQLQPIAEVAWYFGVVSNVAKLLNEKYQKFKCY